jgi:hypothetical protein
MDFYFMILAVASFPSSLNLIELIQQKNIGKQQSTTSPGGRRASIVAGQAKGCSTQLELRPPRPKLPHMLAEEASSLSANDSSQSGDRERASRWFQSHKPSSLIR